MRFRSVLLNAVRMIAVVLALCPVIVLAGPVADFERALRDAYVDYRAALFQSNTSNVPATRQALNAFATKWAGLAKTYAAPPPHYADDPQWTTTLATVATLLKEADGEVEKGRLPQAHEVLEKVRDQIGGLHLRNGIVGFSDRMNTFHEYMEHVLQAKVEPGALDELREQVAVLVYLAAELRKYPAPEVQAADYAPTLQGMIDAVTALQQAVRGGQPEAIKAAMSKVKPAYARMFMKFG
jgi:hypothetical protein